MKTGRCLKRARTGRCVKRAKRRRRSVRGYRRGRSAAKKHRGYRRGRRPFNKGKRCRVRGINRLGRTTCVSYGGRHSKRSRAAHYGAASPSAQLDFFTHQPTAGLSSVLQRRRRSRRRTLRRYR